MNANEADDDLLKAKLNLSVYKLEKYGLLYQIILQYRIFGALSW